jgi:hydroxylaminobenzene mutase
MGQRLVRLGVLLILISLLIGLAVPRFAVPRLALSVHLLGLMQGLFLAIVGMLWPRLVLTPRGLLATFWLLAYGCVAALTANLLGALWGAGNSIVPIAAGTARGTPLQETVIVVVLRSGGAALILGTVLLLWGLRRGERTP